MLDKLKFWKSNGAESEVEAVAPVETEYIAPTVIQGAHMFTVAFDGEKTYGELGNVKEYDIDVESLSARSWQFYLDNAVAHLVVDRFVTWMVGAGLRVQSEPLETILSDRGISIDKEKVTRDIENRFKMFCNSERSVYSKQGNLKTFMSEVVKCAYIGGDCLIINRITDGVQSSQMIDGRHIATPPFYDIKKAIDGGENIITDGVEVDRKGEHVNYYVAKSDGTFYTVKARDDRGRKLAYLFYGKKYSPDDTRGIPLITSVMEKLKKLDRYAEAAVGSAEERQKIAFQIIHNEHSTGAMPLTTSVRSGMGKSSPASKGYHVNSPGEIAVTSEKSVYNLEPGSELKQLSSDNELSFKEFHSTNVDLICASIGISPEVAMIKFEGSYSSSRAAIKDWEHELDVGRARIGSELLQPIYDLWLDHGVLKDKISLQGYKVAIFKNDHEILDSYRNARWTGASVPHIDPLKEVKAERLKLGTSADHLPLTTVEMATENVKGGDSSSNMEQFITESAKIPIPEVKNKEL